MYHHRIIVLIITLVLIWIALIFAMKLRADNSFAALFDVTDQSYNQYLQYQDDFGSDEVTYIVYSVPGNKYGPFDITVMRQIRQLTKALESEVPFVDEVISLTNAEYLEAEEDLLKVLELGIDIPLTQEELLQHRAGIQNKPLFLHSLISKDAILGGIILEMSVASSDSLETIRYDPIKGDAMENLYPQVSVHKVNEILSRPEYAGIDFMLSGDAPMNTAYNEVIGREAVIITALSLALVAIISMICFPGQWLGLVGPLSVVIVSFLFMVGFMGAVGYKTTVMFLIAPTLLTAIGVAQSVHLVCEFNFMRSQGLKLREAIGQTFENVAMPCVLAAITTACGFLVMSSSRLKALSDLSIYLGAGVIFTFLASISVMTCIMASQSEHLSRRRDYSKRQSQVLLHALKAVVAFNLRHRVRILVVSAILITVALVGVSKLHIGFNFLTDFKPYTQFRQDTTAIQESMGGMLNIAVIYDTVDPGGIRDPGILSHLDELQDFANSSPLIRKTYSMVDIIKDINQSLHGGDGNYYQLPEDSAQIAQYLLLYEMSGGNDLEDYVSGDYQSTVLEMRVDLVDSLEVEELYQEIMSWVQAHPLPDVEIRITGIGMLWVKMASYIVDSQLWGYSLVFIIVATILCLAFRSIKVGLLAMIPNLFPVVIVLGAMGWAGMHLDYYRLLIGTVAIGIAVDDTVHLMTRLRKEYLICGNYAEAVHEGVTSVGRALIITTIILSLSFLVFLISDMEVLSSFGFLLSATIVIALLADLFLLPSLVLVFQPFGEERGALTPADNTSVGPSDKRHPDSETYK